MGLSWRGPIAGGFNVLDTDNDSELAGEILAEASTEGDDVKRICSDASKMSCDTDGHKKDGCHEVSKETNNQTCMRVNKSIMSQTTTTIDTKRSRGMKRTPIKVDGKKEAVDEVHAELPPHGPRSYAIGIKPCGMRSSGRSKPADAAFVFSTRNEVGLRNTFSTFGKGIGEAIEASTKTSFGKEEEEEEEANHSKEAQEMCLDAQDASEHLAGALPASAGKLNADIVESACADVATAMCYQDDEELYAEKERNQRQLQEKLENKTGQAIVGKEKLEEKRKVGGHLLVESGSGKKGKKKRRGFTLFCDGCGCTSSSCQATAGLEAVAGVGVHPDNHRKVHQVMPLRTVEPHGVNTVGEEEWVEIAVAVDSGATETVMSAEPLDGVIDITEGPASTRGVKYEVANGVEIPNLGERKFVGVTEEGVARPRTAQICAVDKTLMSVSKVDKAGNRVGFDDDGSYIEHKSTGERIWMEQIGGMCYVKLWVSREGCPGF